MPPAPSRFEVTPTAESHFSWLRTRMSLDRTLMSWVRTAVALIGFGFTIVQFFERLAHMPGAHRAVMPHAPRYIGLWLIGTGVLALVVSVLQYRRLLKYLWGSFDALAGTFDEPKSTPVLPVALALILVGLFAFMAVLLRL